MLKQNIKFDSTEALKSGEHFRLGVLRMLSASILTKEKDKRYKISQEKPDLSEENLIKESELSDEQIVEVIISEIKKRKDAIVLYQRGNRLELAENENKEIDILKKYLPEQLSNEDLKKIILDSINKTGAKEIKDIGRIMADLMPKVKGRADNGEISSIIKELLTK